MSSASSSQQQQQQQSTTTTATNITAEQAVLETEKKVMEQIEKGLKERLENGTRFLVVLSTDEKIKETFSERGYSVLSGKNVTVIEW